MSVQEYARSVEHVRRSDGNIEAGDAWINVHACECKCCGGILKPDVVFFGDNVPPEKQL